MKYNLSVTQSIKVLSSKRLEQPGGICIDVPLFNSCHKRKTIIARDLPSLLSSSLRALVDLFYSFQLYNISHLFKLFKDILLRLLLNPGAFLLNWILSLLDNGQPSNTKASNMDGMVRSASFREAHVLKGCLSNGAPSYRSLYHTSSLSIAPIVR